MMVLRLRNLQSRMSIRQRHEASSSLTRMTALHSERRLSELVLIHNLMDVDGDDAEDVQLIENLMVVELTTIQNCTYFTPAPFHRPVIPSKTIDDLNDSECLLDYRFPNKEQLHRLFQVLQIPQVVSIRDESGKSHVFQGEECFLFGLYRMASGSTLEDTSSHIFGRDPTQWSRVWTWFVKFVVQEHGHLVLNSLPFFADHFDSYNDQIIKELNISSRQFGFEDDVHYTKELCNVCAFVDCSIFLCSRAGSGPTEPGPVALDARHDTD